MSMSLINFFGATCIYLCFSLVVGTIDLNFQELEYIADHLLPEECRKLVAAVHFQSNNIPNSIGQAEQAVPKDISCIHLLLHWNSEKGEGKGAVHEVLEHRLRQIGKIELADWLGKSVFHQLGEDLEKSLKEGINVSSELLTHSKFVFEPTLLPVLEYNNPTEWSFIDTVTFVVLCASVAILMALCIFISCKKVLRKCQNRKKRKKY